MTLPTSDAQSSRILPQGPRRLPSTHSIPTRSSDSPLPMASSSAMSGAGLSDKIEHERAIYIASRSWDLVTGGLKTLTAKRELPPLLDWQPSGNLRETDSVSKYTFALVILGCVLLMLIGGGVVLFAVLQP